MHRLFCFCLLVLIYMWGCVKGETPVERYNKATESVIHGYTNVDIRVAERALRDYRVFLLDEAEIYGMKDYELIYAMTTERLARICEHNGAIREAVTLRDEIEELAMNNSFTMEEVALLVTKLDEANGIGTSTWHNAFATTNAPPAVDGGNFEKKE